MTVFPEPTPPAGPIPDIGLLTREYAAIRELGRGGMGTVVLARHRLASHEVAIKLSDAGAIANAEALSRFQREGKLLSTLRHPNIVRLYDVADMGRGRYGIVMEYVRGVSLAQILGEQGALPLDRCQSILYDLASALDHAHERGVVHRDVKPPNVLVHTGSWAAKLCDFGIARAGSEESSVTGTGIVAGTPAYMAPEHIDGRPLDRRSDLYSLAMLGWEMMTGEQPWRGLPLFDILYHQKYVDLPSVAELRPQAPPSLVLALEGALSKAPQLRWATAREMLEQLESDAPTERLLTIRADRCALQEGNLDLERDLSGESRPGLPPELEEMPRWTARPVDADLPARPPSPAVASESAPTMPVVRVTTPPEAPSVVAPAVSEPDARRHHSNRLALWRTLRRRRAMRVALLLAAGSLMGVFATMTMSRGRGAATSGGGAAEVASRSPAPSTDSAAPGAVESPRPAAVAQALASPAPELPRVPLLPPRVAEAAGGGAPGAATPALGADAARPIPSSTAVVPAPGPFDAVIERARHLADQRRFGVAEQVIDSALTSAPRLAELYALRARVRAARGDIRDAWTDVEMAARTGGRWEVLGLETSLRAQRDGRSAAREYLSEDVKAALVPRRMLEPARAFGLARALVAAGDKSTALTVLGQTRSPDPSAGPLFDDPALAPLARDPRFQALRRRVVGDR